MPCAAASPCSTLGKVLGAEVQAAHGHDGFDVRVGVHTGGVLLGGGVDCRRQHSRHRGQHRRPHGADRAGRGACASATIPTPRCAACSRSSARSRWRSRASTSPIQSYLVLRAKPRSFRLGTPRHRRRGHADDRPRRRTRGASGRLQAACSSIAISPPSPWWPMPASARAGCSTSSRPGATHARRRFVLFRGRATPQTQGQPFGLLRDIIAWRFQIADDDSIETARRKMEQGIVPLFLDDDGPDLAGRPCPSARPSDRHRVAREPPRQGHPRRPQADPQPRLPRRGAAVPPHRRRRRSARRPAARRPALGRQREPGLPRLPGGGRPRRAAADAGLQPADAVRAQGELVCGRGRTGGSTCNRSART